MQSEWDGTGYSEEKEQAFQDCWALRILTCPRAACRRARRCRREARPERCPGLERYPFSEQESHERVRMVRAMIKRRLEEIEAGRRPSAAAEAASAAADKRRRALALENARRMLKQERGRK